MTILKELHWIAIDWGSSNLRVWALDNNNAILDSISSNDGMLGLATSEFEPLLFEKISKWGVRDVKIPILCCGMVGAKQGWVEAPYASIPYNLMQEADSVKVSCSDDRLNVRILGGLRQDNPADVMRGEETQIRGFLSIFSNFDGIIKTLKIKVGDKVSEGDLILILESISEAQEKVGKRPPIVKEIKKTEEIKTEVQKTSADQNKFLNISSASPKVRKFARELGVDINQVVGSERKGRVVM